MSTSRRPDGHSPVRQRSTRRTVGLLVASIGIAMPLLTSAAPVPLSPEGDVASFLDGVPGWVNNEDAECAGNKAGVGYVDNRLLVSGPVWAGELERAVHEAVRARVGPRPGSASWVENIEKIEFPKVPSTGGKRRELYQVDLVARPEGHDLLQLSRDVADALPEVDVSPDHALVPAGPINQFWPNGYPRKADGLDVARNAPFIDSNGDSVPAGTGVRIAIYDTGLAQPADPSKLPQVQRMEPFDTDVPDPDGDKVAYSLVAGHALAMAGVIQTVAPGADIEVARIANEGLATDTTTVKRIASSIRGKNPSNWPHVIVLAFGSPACLLDPNDPKGGYLEPVGLKHAVDVITQLAEKRDGGMVVVASAGNRGERRPYYPAAFDNVIGVGALDLTLDADGSPWTATAGTGDVAPFSNRGNWVDAWTPGVSLPTTHVNGMWLDDNPLGPFLEGYGRVDGTSFSAPVFAGMIADQASRVDGGDVRCAWLELEDAAGRPLPIKAGRKAPAGAAVVLTSWDDPPAASTGLIKDPVC